MNEARTIVEDLAVVFCVATAVTIVFQRLRQPAVLGYLLAGLVVGPHLPFPLFADQARIQSLSELGVVLVMFSLGLELSLARLARLLPTAGLVGIVQATGMLWLGYVVGRLFGWSGRESLFVGGMVCISSTMIAVRVLATQRVDGALTEWVVGLLIVQDLAAVVLIAVFTAIASGSGLPAADVARTVGQLVLFLAAVIAAGMLIVPRLVREADRDRVPESRLVASVGVCFGLALLSEQLGYSVALGAFIGGVLVGESGRRRAVEHQIAPLRDVFAAVFFVSIGMLVDPRVFIDQALLIAVLSAVVVAGMSLFISLGSFLVGRGVRLSVRAGMSLAQVGEFAFILVGIGVAAGVASSELLGVAVGVSIVTAFFTPMLVRASEPAALALERRLPRALQTYASLYASWFERGGEPRARSRLRRLSAWFAVDASILLVVVVVTAVGRDWFASALAHRFGLDPDLALAVVIAAAALVALPFAVGVPRLARALGREIALRALPERAGVDLATASRRAYVVSLQLGLVLLAVFPVFAATQPFVPLYLSTLAFAAIAITFGFRFWQSTTNLAGHVRAVAEVVFEALHRQRAEIEAEEESAPAPARGVAELLPGLGELTAVPIGPSANAAGKTLAELNLRGLTGATVLAIERASGGVVSPTGRETIEAGDLLSVAGSREAIAAACALLTAPAAQGANEG